MDDLETLFRELVRFEIELWAGLDERLRAELGVPLGTVEPMRIIARTPNCRVFDIANDLSVTVGGVSKGIDRLEKAGYVARRANPDDRRSSILELTPAGRELLTRADAVYADELETRLRATVSPTALRQFISTLTRLRAGAQLPGVTAVTKEA